MKTVGITAWRGCIASAGSDAWAMARSGAVRHAIPRWVPVFHPVGYDYLGAIRVSEHHFRGSGASPRRVSGYLIAGRRENSAIFGPFLVDCSRVIAATLRENW